MISCRPASVYHHGCLSCAVYQLGTFFPVACSSPRTTLVAIRYDLPALYSAEMTWIVPLPLNNDNYTFSCDPDKRLFMYRRESPVKRPFYRNRAITRHFTKNQSSRIKSSLLNNARCLNFTHCERTSERLSRGVA